MKLKENWTLILLGFSILALIGLGAIVVLRPAQKEIDQSQETEEPAKQPEVFESEPVASCQLSFNLPTGSPTPTNSPTPTPTSINSPTPTPTEILECWETCKTNSDCPSDLMCLYVDNQEDHLCANSQCPSENSCVCPGPTNSPTPTNSQTPGPTNSPTPTPIPTTPPSEPGGPTPTPITLEQAGMTLPTLGAAGGGLFLLLTSLLLLL